MNANQSLSALFHTLQADAHWRPASSRLNGHSLPKYIDSSIQPKNGSVICACAINLQSGCKSTEAHTRC